MKLTADEIKLVVFIVVALLVGAITKHYRHRGEGQLPPARAATTQNSAAGHLK